MALDVSTLIFPAQYATWGVTATLTLKADDSEHSVQVIDRSAGIEVAGETAFPTDNFRQETFVTTMVPGCYVRVADLLALAIGTTVDEVRQALRRSSLTFNGKTWRIENTRPKPTTNGEADGELIVYLIEA